MSEINLFKNNIKQKTNKELEELIFILLHTMNEEKSLLNPINKSVAKWLILSLKELEKRKSI